MKIIRCIGCGQHQEVGPKSDFDGEEEFLCLDCSPKRPASILEHVALVRRYRHNPPLPGAPRPSLAPGPVHHSTDA